MIHGQHGAPASWRSWDCPAAFRLPREATEVMSFFILDLGNRACAPTWGRNSGAVAAADIPGLVLHPEMGHPWQRSKVSILWVSLIPEPSPPLVASSLEKL